MILTEQQPSSPSSKRSFLSISVPSRPSSPEDEAPPAYRPPLPTSPVPPPPPTPIHKEHPNTGKRRFWRAILIGLGVYVVVSATVITPLLVLKLRGSKSTITPDPVQTSPVPDHRDPHNDRPPPHDRPHWPPPGGADGDGRWDMPPPRHHDHDRPPPPGGPHGPKGWHPDCGGEGDGRPGCHRPPNVPHWDGQIVQCNGWRRPTLEEQLPATDPLPFNSFLMYEMPLDKDLFVRAAGLITAGAFQLVVDDKLEKIQAHVEMRFNEHRSYEHTNVCLMDRQHSNPPAMGLGIYMPFGQAPNENVLFNITLRVPPMHYNGTLDTHLPVFEQKILSDPRVYFNRLRLSGSASPMLMQGVDAGTIDAMTQYARIKADGVRAGRQVRLATNASPIDATIAVTSNSSSSEPVVIDMQTINAHIAGTVLLAHDGTIKASGSEGTPDFLLDAKTGNSPIFMRVLHTEQSQPAVLHANLTTNLAEIEVSLDPSYEGTFELLTDGTSAAEVEEDSKHTLDPSGMGRRRAVSLHRDGEGSVRGSVAWRNLSFRMKEGALGIWGADKLKDTSLGGSRVRAATSLGQNTLLLPNSQDMLRDTEERAAHFRTLKEDEVDTVAERMRKVGNAVSV